MLIASGLARKGLKYGERLEGYCGCSGDQESESGWWPQKLRGKVKSTCRQDLDSSGPLCWELQGADNYLGPDVG